MATAGLNCRSRSERNIENLSRFACYGSVMRPATNLDHVPAIQRAGWLVLLLFVPLLELFVGTVLGSSVPTFRTNGWVMHIDPRTGERTLHPEPIDYRREMGEAALPTLLVLPLLQCGCALLAVFGPFSVVRDALGRKRMALAACLSLPAAAVCCLLARWSITYINL